MDIKLLTENIHRCLLNNNITHTTQLKSRTLPFKLLHEIYQMFPVNNVCPQFVSNGFDQIPLQVLYRGNPKNRISQWIRDIQNDEYTYHLHKAKNADNFGERLRFGHGYYFTNSLDYVFNYLARSHHKCDLVGDKMDYIIRCKIQDNASLVDLPCLEKQLDSIFPSIDNSPDFELRYNNTKEEILLLSAYLFRHEYHKLLGSLLLKYDGLRIERSTSSKSVVPIIRTEYVVSNRAVLIIEDKGLQHE